MYYKDRCFFLRFKETLSLQRKFLHRDELAWTLFMCTNYLNNFHEHGVLLDLLEKLMEH